jgi:hypothetical protein
MSKDRMVRLFNELPTAPALQTSRCHKHVDHNTCAQQVGMSKDCMLRLFHPNTSDVLDRLAKL